MNSEQILRRTSIGMFLSMILIVACTEPEPLRTHLYESANVHMCDFLDGHYFECGKPYKYFLYMSECSRFAESVNDALVVSAMIASVNVKRKAMCLYVEPWAAPGEEGENDRSAAAELDSKADIQGQ